MLSSELINTKNLNNKSLIKLIDLGGYYTQGPGSNIEFFRKSLERSFAECGSEDCDEIENILNNYPNIAEYWVDLSMKNPNNFTEDGEFILSNFERETKERYGRHFWTDWSYMGNPVNKYLPFVVINFYLLD